MNGHSLISGPPPSHLFRLFGTNRGRYGDLSSAHNWNILIDDVVANFAHKLGYWNTTVSSDELRQNVEEHSVAALLRFIYEKEARYEDASHIFVKENHSYSFAPFLLAQFPDCKFVWLVRDPRDVTSSWLNTPTMPGGVEKAVEVWSKDQEASLELFHQLQDSGRILRIYYEDLVGETVRSLTRLTTFLGLSYEERMLEFNTQRRTVENARRIDAWANLQNPVLSANTKKYRAILSEADQRYIELACHSLMVQFSYAGDFITEPPAAETRTALLDELRPSVNAGSYSIPSSQEQEIRERRLAAVQRVLTRRL